MNTPLRKAASLIGVMGDTRDLIMDTQDRVLLLAASIAGGTPRHVTNAAKTLHDMRPALAAVAGGVDLLMDTWHAGVSFGWRLGWDARGRAEGIGTEEPPSRPALSAVP